MVAQVVNGSSTNVPGYGTLNLYNNEDEATALSVSGQYLVPQQNQDSSMWIQGLNPGSARTINIVNPAGRHPGAYDTQQLVGSYAEAYANETGNYPGDIIIDILIAICIIVALILLPPALGLFITVGILVGGLVACSIIDNSYATTETVLSNGDTVVCGGGSLFTGKTCVTCPPSGTDCSQIISPAMTDVTNIALILGVVAIGGIGAYLLLKPRQGVK
jgi:hypothetical protein